jgi:hypothetical protein
MAKCSFGQDAGVTPCTSSCRLDNVSVPLRHNAEPGSGLLVSGWLEFTTRQDNCDIAPGLAVGGDGAVAIATVTAFERRKQRDECIGTLRLITFQKLGELGKSEKDLSLDASYLPKTSLSCCTSTILGHEGVNIVPLPITSPSAIDFQRVVILGLPI